MKKALIILISLLICLTLTACTNNNNIPNPMYECESLEEINKTANVHLVKPGVTGVKDEKFYMRDNDTAEYVYNLKGHKYYMRGCRDTSIDMSGLFRNGKPLFDDCLEEKIVYREGDGYRAYRFILGDKQYIFGVENNESISKDELENQFNEIYQQVMYDSTFKEIINVIGDYIDSQSQRATLTIKLEEVNLPTFNISWSSNSSQVDEWIIKTTYDGVKFLYKEKEIIHNSVVYLEDGTPITQQVDDVQEGYFGFDNGKLIWMESLSDQEPKCIFERNN